MLKRTHLAIGLGVAFYFLPHIQTNKFVFLGVVLLASILPDLESGFSPVQRHSLFSLQSEKTLFHRNSIFHTYTFLLPITIVLALFYPVLALPFFLGFSFHLFLDSFSPKGIRPFWPLKHHTHGKIVPGGSVDKILFLIFISIDVLLIFKFVLI